MKQLTFTPWKAMFVSQKNETKPRRQLNPKHMSSGFMNNSNKTRVALFTNSVAVGGMEEHVKLLARHLNRTNFEVYSITPQWTPTEPFSQAMQKVSDRAIEITPDKRYGKWKEVKETFRFFRQLRKWRVDVLHMHSTTYRGQLLAFAMAKVARIRRIYVTEHLAPENTIPFTSRVIRNAFSALVDGIVCVSQKNYEARANYLYTPKKRVTVVNNGVDPDDFVPIKKEVLDELRAKYNLPENAQVVGTVVRFEPEKGLEYLIEAMKEIKAACPNAYLLMVGDGSLREELVAQVEKAGLSECTRFTGFQSNPRPFLGLIDAFVLPVPVGSMSIGLLEAMAMERAVIITFGGVGEAVIDGESGFCAEPRNPASIAAAVIKTLSDPALQLRLGKAARERVEEEFSAQRVARQLQELYLQ